jgi:hypothetical protein
MFSTSILVYYLCWWIRECKFVLTTALISKIALLYNSAWVLHLAGNWWRGKHLHTWRSGHLKIRPDILRTCVANVRLRCVWVFVKLRSVAYATICCLPHMGIMCHHERGSKDIFRPHTEAFACWRCVFFIPWTAGVNIFFARTWKRTSWRAHRYAGCPWGRHGRETRSE